MVNRFPDKVWNAAGALVVAMNRDDVLLNAPEAVFRIWHFREKIEVEAASIFGYLGKYLSALCGDDYPLAILALKAQADELRHKQLCRAIVECSNKDYPLVPLTMNITLGPQDLSIEQRVLYTAVAMGCVTETLSTALLLQMHKRANAGIIKDTVHSILKDEVNHARIGWGEIARVHGTRDITWLNKHIPAMITTALASDIAPMLNEHGQEVDLSIYGILTRKEAKLIMQEAIESTIYPGLKKYGLLLDTPNQQCDLICL